MVRRIFVLTTVLSFFFLQVFAADIPGVLVVDDKNNRGFVEEILPEIRKSLMFEVNTNRTVPVCLGFSSSTGVQGIINYIVQSVKNTDNDIRVVLLSYGSGLITSKGKNKYLTDSITFKKNLEVIISKANELNLEIIWYNHPFTHNADLDAVHRQLNAIASNILRKNNIIGIDYYGFSRVGNATVKSSAAFLSESLAQWWTASAKNNKSVRRIRLWDGQPPHYEYRGEEFVNSLARIDNVSIPELELFLPDSVHAKATIIFFPGGAYQFLGFLRNARELAEIVNPYEIAVVGLKYRTKRETNVTLCDAQRIVRYVRANANPLGVSNKYIGVLGQSAGAHLTLNLCSNYTNGDTASSNRIERESSRPDFAGVFSSWNFGLNKSDFNFTKNLPPFFIRHAKDDPSFDLAKILTLQIAEKSSNVNVRFLESGGHNAFEISEGKTGKDWVDDFLRWLYSVVEEY